MDLPLAVYGTLLPDCGGQKYLGIDELLEDLGPCTLSGRLWLTKEIVADEELRLVPAYYPEEEGVVQAHLFRVPQEVWGHIDAFKDFVPHSPDSPYTRKEVTTLEGESAWAYCASENLERSNYLRDGDWRLYAFHPRAIPLFHCPDPF